MKELGITKGESVYPKAQPVARNGFYILTDTAFIGEVGGGYLEIEQYKALAELFADACNTARKCGLLPSELLRQRDTIYVLAVDFISEVIKGTGADRAGNYAIKIETAIKSTEQ